MYVEPNGLATTSSGPSSSTRAMRSSAASTITLAGVRDATGER
jgi:hypothetical protein